MLRDRALQVRMVKSAPTGETPETVVQTLDLKQIETIVQNQVTNAAILFGAVLGGKKILDTVCEIAIITAKAKIR